jgi:hypothetical protein
LIEFFRKIRDSKWFENSIFAVIVFAGIIVGLETYPEIKNNYHSLLLLADNLVLWIFVIELIVRTGSEINKPHRLFTSGWYLFDFFIVVICFVPYFLSDFNSAFFVVLRMARIMRMLKLFERVHNLKILIQSLARSIPSMSYVLILLFLQFYIFAVIGTDLFGKYEPESFGSLLVTMKTLFFVSFEGWSWIYELPGIKNALADGMPDYAIVVYFISFIVIAAVIFLNLFIGILTAEISQSKLEESNTKKKIFQTNHTLILGWSQQIYSIIDNLIIANESESSSTIVILADKNKKSMEDELIVHIHDFKYTKLIFREGSPTNMDYLRLVRPDEAKSIIVLSQDIYGRHDDINTIKQILALMHTKTESTNFNIIADIDDEENVKLARTLTGNFGCVISTEEMIGKIIAQTGINKGLSKVYEEIIGFRGSEIYIHKANEIEGNTFGELMLMYPECIPLGIYDSNANIQLNPDSNRKIVKGDSLIVLSEDDSTIKISKKDYKNDLYDSSIEIKDFDKLKKQKILILGWNLKGYMIIDQLFGYLAEGSELQIVSENSSMYDDCNRLSNLNPNFNLSCQTGKINNYKDLHSYELPYYNHIIILSNNSTIADFQECDANTLITLINVRAIQNEQKCNFSIAAELLDRENQKLANTQLPGDFIVGPDIISSFIAMISENRKIYDVYMELFSSYGSEIFNRDINFYFKPNSTVDFYTITKAALQRNEIAIGYLNSSGKAVINPKKSDIIKIEKEMKLFIVTKQIN